MKTQTKTYSNLKTKGQEKKRELFKLRNLRRVRDQSGYIAIISALILAALIIAIVASISLSAFVGRNNILNASFKEMSRSLTNACMNVALLKLVLNPDYTGGETVTVSSDCDIISVTTNGNQKTVTVRAVSGGATTNIRRVINSSDFTILNLEEF